MVSLESISEKEGFQYVEGGKSGISFTFIEDGQRIFQKVLHDNRRKYSLSDILGAERRFRRKKIYTAPHLCCRKSIVPTREESIRKEVETIEEWRRHGINVPEILGYDWEGIRYAYIDGETPEENMAAGKFSSDHLQGLMSLYHQIRAFAFSRDNPQLFHSDAHLRNFLYSEEEGKFYAIDPGVVIDDSMYTEIIDASLNLFFFYSLLDVPIDLEDKRRYLMEVVETFERDSIRTIRMMNKDLPKSFRFYIDMREEIAYRIKGGRRTSELKGFTPENLEMVNDVLDTYL